MKKRLNTRLFLEDSKAVFSYKKCVFSKAVATWFKVATKLQHRVATSLQVAMKLQSNICNFIQSCNKVATPNFRRYANLQQSCDVRCAVSADLAQFLRDSGEKSGVPGSRCALLRTQFFLNYFNPDVATLGNASPAVGTFCGHEAGNQGR